MRAIETSGQRGVRRVRRCLSVGIMVVGVSACVGLAEERSVYDQGGVKIGLQPDPTVIRSKTEVRNAHPALLSGGDVRSLLSVAQVSGYSGTLSGLFQNPRAAPLLTDDQLNEYSDYIADAFRKATPMDRVWFSFPKPGVAYSEDRTEGALFIRDRYLHVVVTDHSSILHADTGGGEERDIRDTKALKLWVARPVQPATVPDSEEPEWAPFETVHISLNVKEVLALHSAAPSIRLGRERGGSVPKSAETTPSGRDLQNQVRELTNSNLELRQRLDEQTKRMKDLTEEMNRLRLDLEESRPAKQSPRKSSPSSGDVH